MAAVIRVPTSFGAGDMFVNYFPSYMKLYDGDYIEHQGAYEALKPFLKACSNSFSMLDLGCGDAWALCRVLSQLQMGSSLRAYTGVDLSAPAIEIAKQNVRQLNKDCKLQWEVSDMLSYLQGSQGHFDYIIASFSMHHLTPGDKLAVLREGRRLLDATKGSLFMVDVLRQQGESVQGYRDRICGEAARDWTLVDPAGRQALIDHMQAYDMPDSWDDFTRMGREAGFARVQQAHLGKKLYGNLIVFSC